MTFWTPERERECVCACVRTRVCVCVCINTELRISRLISDNTRRYVFSSVMCAAISFLGHDSCVCRSYSAYLFTYIVQFYGIN